MEFNSLNFSLILIITTLILLLMIYHRFYPERFTRIAIGRNIKLYLYPQHYHLIENIDLNCTNGEKLQIKQLVVSRYGLFIIETYHHRGIIYGSNHQVKWLSTGSMHSRVFVNPSMSHQPSCDILANYLQLPPAVINLISVFTGNSRLLVPAPTNSCNPDSLIRAISEHRDVRINPKLLPTIIAILQNTQKQQQLVMKYNTKN